MKTLIVEDDFVSRLLLQKLLAPYGKSHIAANGSEAIKAFHLAIEEEFPYDLVCLDIMMPVMDGHEVLRKIRNIEDEQGIQEQDRVKIIMTTALADLENIRRAARGKCDAYLHKPISKQMLIDKLRSIGLLDRIELLDRSDSPSVFRFYNSPDNQDT